MKCKIHGIEEVWEGGMKDGKMVCKECEAENQCSTNMPIAVTQLGQISRKDMLNRKTIEFLDLWQHTTSSDTYAAPCTYCHKTLTYDNRYQIHDDCCREYVQDVDDLRKMP